MKNMKKILSIIISLILSLSFLTYNVFANEIEPTAAVCPVVSGYKVKSKQTYIKFDTVKPVQNATSSPHTYTISLTRYKSTSLSGELEIDFIENILGFNVEISADGSSSVIISQNVYVPAYTTYYAAFGSMYVEAEIQYHTVNSNCSETWSGPIYTEIYTYDDYIGTYEIMLKTNYEYTKSYLDSLNLR